jgi:hypothetical protein
MTITPLSTLALLPPGTNLECIEIQLTKVDDAPTAFGQGTKQGSFATDAGGAKATVQFIDFEALDRAWVGPWMKIVSHKNGKGDFTGIEVDEYNGKKRIRIRGNDQHGNPRVTINWLESIPAAPAQAAPPARQGPPAHRSDIVYDTHPQQAQQRLQNPPPRQAGPPPQSGPPPQAARQAQPPAQPSRPPVPAGPHGATVGMAVKEAFTALIESVRHEAIAEELRNPAFWQDVHQAASEILHVCKALESGDIAPSIVTAALPDYPAEEAEAAEEEWTA